MSKLACIVILPLLSECATIVHPGDSLSEAVSLERGGGTVILASGSHFLADTLVLGSADSGLTIRGEPGATIDGGVVLDKFTVISNSLWQTPLPIELANSSGGLSALYVNGDRRLRARAPNAVGLPPWSFQNLVGDAATFHMTSPIEPCTLPSFGKCPEVDRHGFIANLGEQGSPNASWGDLSGAFVAVAQAWQFEWTTLSAINFTSGRVDFNTPTVSAVGAFGSDSKRPSPSGGRWFLENAMGALDYPGEFYIDLVRQVVLYVPLPGETPATVVAVIPNLTTLTHVRGGDKAPVSNITIADVAFRNFGEGGPLARLGYWAYSAGLVIGPNTENVTLRNLTITAGVATGVGISPPHVIDTLLDRLTIHDTGGRGIGPIGDLTTTVQTCSALTVANTTVSHVGFVFFSGACGVAAAASGTRIVNNDISDTPYSGVMWDMPGGPSRDAAPTFEVAFNRITDTMQGVLSDGASVYITANEDDVAALNWVASDVHHNFIASSHNYDGGYGANGLYSDHATSGTAFFSNIITGFGGRAGSLHCGNGLRFESNLVYDVTQQNFSSGGKNNGALSSCGTNSSEPGFSANVSGNIFFLVGTRNAWAPQDVTWSPPNDIITGGRNLWWGPGPIVFPGASSLPDWNSKTGGAEARSLVADPLLADPARGNFTVLPNSPAWALGWIMIDETAIGVLPAA